MSAAATRDDLAAVVTALTEQAATQRQWQADYEAKAATARVTANAAPDETERGRFRGIAGTYERFAAQARGTAHAFEVSADMINKYVGVE